MSICAIYVGLCRLVQDDVGFCGFALELCVIDLIKVATNDDWWSVIEV